MNKIILTLTIILTITFDCITVQESGLRHFRIRRCENDEIICYTTDGRTAQAITCKFKEKKEK